MTSPQAGVHPNLKAIVEKHRIHPFRRPIADHTKKAFNDVQRASEPWNGKFILDAGCGTGDSSRQLASLFPTHLIVGIDKSHHRLTKERATALPSNLRLVRADLVDFYRLAATAAWSPQQHFILYPNPWPKVGHLKRRWHGSPVLPDLLCVGRQLTLRTNWHLYAKEFSEALTAYGYAPRYSRYHPADAPLTPFEDKYHKSGQPLWEVTAELANRRPER
ncbi:MAG: methyltransferase domain-containing protein [Pseudomonadota bacterium]